MDTSDQCTDKLESPPIQKPVFEPTEQVVKTEAVEIDTFEHFRNTDRLWEHCRDSQSNLSEYVKNEPIDNDEASIEYSDGETTISATSVKVESIEFEEQQMTQMHIKAHPIIHGEEKSCEGPYCPRRFSTISNRNRHKAIHEGIKREPCDICGKSIAKNDLKKHKLTHSDVKAHKCELCEMRFVKIAYLRKHMRTHTGEKPYKCKYCENSFAQRSIRMNHMRFHLGSNIYRCELCPLAFPVLSELREHLTTHKNEDPETRERNMKALQEAETKLELKFSKQQFEIKDTEHGDDKPYECPFCPRRFSNRGNMYRHKITHGPVKREDCDICGKSIIKRNLKEHKLIHSNDKAYKCDRCEKRKVKAHRIKHDEDRPYECPYCPRRFKTTSNLYHHKAIHSGVEREACDICGKSFNKYWLKQHKLTHGGERPHKCHLCEKSFLRLDHLRAHIRIHTGEKPYQCEYCERSFSESGHRMYHMRLHLGDKIHRCELCPLAFAVHSELRVHFATHKNEDPETRERNMKALKEVEADLQIESTKTETPQSSKQQFAIKDTENAQKDHLRHDEEIKQKFYECPYCPQRFHLSSNMYQHKRIHEGIKREACDICGKLINKYNLKQHKLTHSTEKAHKCDFCGKCFVHINYLRNHMPIHTGEKKYKCKYCERAFGRYNDYRNHMTIHLGVNIHRCELCPLAFPVAKELRVHFATHKDEDSETRKRNLKALQEAEAKLQLKSSKNETQQPSKEESKQQLEIKAKE